MVDVNQLLDVFRRFAVTMSETFEVNHMLYQLGDAASSVLCADGAGITLASANGRLEFVTATDRNLIDLEMVQETYQAGPCVEAFRRGEPVVVTDIATEVKVDIYRKAAAAANYGAVIGMPLAIGEHRIGSMNIYHRRRREWSDDEVDAVAALADIATAYIVRAGELAKATTTAEQLQQALDSRVIIEQAKGSLSRYHGISTGAAFELMRNYSRSNNRTIRDVAAAIVDDQLDIS